MGGPVVSADIWHIRVTITISMIAGVLLMCFAAPAAEQSQEEVEWAIEGVKLDILPPGLPTRYRVGDRFSIIHHNEKAYQEVISIKNGLVTFRASYGCEWSKSDLFSPPVKWSDCDGTSGTQQILSQTGSPWPLTAGKTFSYTVKGSDSRGNRWLTVQRCRVEGMYSISISSGEHKTYKIVCIDDWLHQTWYWSPVLREWVKYLRKHSEEREMCNTDMLGISPADVRDILPIRAK